MESSRPAEAPADHSRPTESADLLKTGGVLAWCLDAATGPAGAAEGAWRPGDRVGRLTIQSLIGRGGMGEVYRGVDEKLGRPVAIKRLRPDWRLDSASRERMLREAQILSKLQHPGICQIFDLIEAEDADVLVMEFVEGATLSAARPGLGREQKLVVAERIADAIAAAHRRGVIHRDLKADNVMVSSDGSVKVLDFGIAFSLAGPAPVTLPDGAAALETPGADETQIGWGSRLTTRGMIVGTPRYMSPEQVGGTALTTASDIYSLGIMLQEFFTGTPAYGDVEAQELVRRVLRGDSASPSGLDPDLARLLVQMKDRSPEKRPTAEQVAARLRQVRAKPARRRFIAAAVVVCLALVGITAVVSLRLGHEAPLIPAGQRGRVVLLPFENDTGEARLAWVSSGLRDLVAQTLDGVEGIEVVSPERVDRLFGDVARASADIAALQRLVSDLGAEVLVHTVVRKDEGVYVFESEIMTRGGRAGKRTIRQPDLSKAASALSDRLVHRLVPVAAYSGLEDRFSDDPLANRLYAMGLDSYRKEGAGGASDCFRVALRVDPELQWARVMLGECADRLASWDESRRYLDEALAYARKTQDLQMISACTSRMARLAIHRNEFDEAERLAQSALRMARDLGDRERETEALAQLGEVMRSREEWKKAEEYYREALAIRRQLGDRIGEAIALHNVGVAIASQHGRLDEARSVLDESLKLKRSLNMMAFEAMTLNSLAYIAMKQGRLDEATRLYEQALQSYREMRDPSSASQCSRTWATSSRNGRTTTQRVGTMNKHAGWPRK
ncbi:MAG: serine/threonine-protein kinase [Acidobacteriota bacterium]